MHNQCVGGGLQKNVPKLSQMVGLSVLLPHTFCFRALVCHHIPILSKKKFFKVNSAADEILNAHMYKKYQEIQLFNTIIPASKC